MNTLKYRRNDLIIEEASIFEMNRINNTYIGADKLLTQCTNRLRSINPDANPLHFDEINHIKMSKDAARKKLLEYVRMFPIYRHWFYHIPGVGPSISAGFILSYYYKFLPICKHCKTPYPQKLDEEGNKIFKCVECGKKAKGKGNLEYKIYRRHYQTISKLWAFMGRNIVNGKMVQKKKGEQANWNSRSKHLGYLLTEQFIRRVSHEKIDSGVVPIEEVWEKYPYSATLYEYRKKIEREYPLKHDIEKKTPKQINAHIHFDARSRTVKLFLSHMWVVAMTLEGKKVTHPYAKEILGHTNITLPFHFDLENFEIRYRSKHPTFKNLKN